jgi:hypothetical protein
MASAPMLHRVDWLAMFVLAGFEIVQKIAGREWRRGSPPAQGAAQSAVLKTESAVQMRRPAGTGFVEDP